MDTAGRAAAVAESLTLSPPSSIDTQEKLINTAKEGFRDPNGFV
jgi:hypothetical protein